MIDSKTAKNPENEYQKETNPPPDSHACYEEIGYPVQVFFTELLKLHMNAIPWQWHPELEVIIVNHGTIKFMTSDESIELTPGEGVVINANVMHSVVPATEDANCSMYSMMFHPKFLFGLGGVMISEKYLLPVTNNKSFQYLIIRDEDERTSHILNHVNEIIAYNLLKQFGYELKTKSRLCSFWLDLLTIVIPHEMPKKILKSITVDEARTKDMILYIEANYAEKITLDDLAASVHISRSECCRCFKRALNLTPIEYLMRFRISTAATMIQNNSPAARSFSELAFAVGFNNASYFNKVFREYLGCTPSEYKKKSRNDPSFDPFKSQIV